MFHFPFILMSRYLISSILGKVEHEVDEIAAAWSRVRPELDVAPLHVLSRISRLARRLTAIRQEAFSAHGLDVWEFDVLAALRRRGEPYELTPGQLAAQTFVTSGTMTNRLDRLGARGLVERHPSPTDRRGVVVRLAEQGRVLVDAAFSDLLAAERELVGVLPAEDQAGLADQLRVLLQHVEPRN